MRSLTTALISALTLVWGAGAEIVVNTTDDVVNADDGLISLREAMTLAADSRTPTAGDDCVHIVFSPELFANANEIKVIVTSADRMDVPAGRAVAIEGPGGNRSVWIADGFGYPDRAEYVMINVATGGVLRLENLSFAGCNRSAYKRAEIRSFGELEVVNCRINGDGSLSQVSFLLESGRACIRNCTFDKTVVTHEALVNARNSVTGGVVNCTFSRNQIWYATLVSVADRANVGCFGCTFEGTIHHDAKNPYNFKVSGAARLELAGCVFGAGSSLTIGGGGAICRANQSASLGYEREIVRDGVKHVCYPNLEYGNGGEFIGYTPDWKSVFTSSKKSGADRHYLRGTNAISIVMVTKDQVGRDINEGHVSPGSYATLTKFENMDPSAITINSRTDGTHTSVDDMYSDRFELREVLDYLKENPGRISADGETRITFDKTYFTSQTSERLRMQRSQIEIDGFTKRKLVIDGGDTHVMFDGAATAGGSLTNRLFYVAPGNRVEFRNLEFVNGVANVFGTAVNVPGGGAILNRGEILVTNCSFRACSAGADSSGHADGGAILTDGGAKTVLYGVTIENCSAARGGAIAVRDGGTNVIAATTMTGNRAVRGAQAGTVSGGAVHCAGDGSATVIVQSSITGNVSDGTGGGVAVAGSGKATSLYLLDTVIVGNRANGVVDDLRLANRAKARYSVLGARLPKTDSLFDVETTNVEEGRMPVDVFAEIDRNGGAAVARTVNVLGVGHSVLPLANDRGHSAAKPLADAAWENVGYEYDSARMALFGLLRLVKQRARELPLDQVGNVLSECVGATTLHTDPTVPYSSNPLLVTSATAEALKAAVANAEANPLLADADGVFDVVFAAGVSTISFAGVDPIAPKVPLRIRGPVTFSGATKGVFELNAAASLYLEQVVFSGCMRAEYGGAIHGVNAKLAAEGCTFRNCRALSSEGAWGGAICLEETEGSADLVDCDFSDCSAQDGTYGALGQSIYHDDRNLRMRDCTFDGSVAPTPEQVYELPSVRIDRPVDTNEFPRCTDGVSRRYHDTAAAAIGECRYGDTFAVVSENCPDLDVVSNSLPSGVSFAIETGPAQANGPAMSAMLGAVAARTALDLAGKDWLKMTASDSAVEVSVDWEKSAPRLDGDSVAELSDDGCEMLVTPSNVKPRISYGLGRSPTPDGEYVVGEWLQADEEGKLPGSLSAPASGDASFYRVFAR